MFISQAFAQAPEATGSLLGGGGGFEAFIPFLLIIVIFYFLLIRPQQKRLKQHRAQLAAIRRGDKIVTSGGVIGTVIKVVNDGELSVEIADNVRVRVMRDTVATVLTADGGPAANDKGKPKDKAAETAAETRGTAADPASTGGTAGKLKSLLEKK